MESLKISVVTVCYNAVSTIEETMLSVLNQTYDNVEYIIIDGGSTDGTVDIIKKYADRLAYWVSEPDRGIYDAMNKGIAVATGDYINFMNAGDKFHNISTLNNCVKHTVSKPTIIYGDWVESINGLIIAKKAIHLKYLKKGMSFPHQSVLFSTTFHKKNLYNQHYRIAADYDLIYHAYLNKEKFSYIGGPIAIYDMSPNKSISLKNYKLLIREHLEIQGYHNNFLICLISQLKTYELRIRDSIKGILPPKYIIKLKQYLNHRLNHSIV